MRCPTFGHVEVRGQMAKVNSLLAASGIRDLGFSKWELGTKQLHLPTEQSHKHKKVYILKFW